MKATVRQVETIERQLRRREESPDDGWDERDALKAWVEVCGPTTMDYDLHKFVRFECEMRGEELTAKWQDLLVVLINHFLRHGMPMERLADRPAYAEEKRQSRNAEEALLAALSACAAVTSQPSQVAWPDPAAFGRWLKELQGQRTSPENPLVMSCLGRLDLAEQALHFIDLYGASLYGASLEGASLDLTATRTRPSPTN